MVVVVLGWGPQEGRRIHSVGTSRVIPPRSPHGPRASGSAHARGSAPLAALTVGHREPRPPLTPGGGDPLRAALRPGSPRRPAPPDPGGRGGGFPTPSARRPHARNPDPRRRERSARPRPPMVPRGGGGRPMSAIPACRAAGQQPEQPRPHPLPPLRASSRPPSASEEPPPAPRPLPPPRAAARPAMPSRAR